MTLYAMLQKEQLGIAFKNIVFKPWCNDWRCNPEGIYLPKVKNRNTRTRCEVCSKSTIKHQSGSQWRRSSVFIVNFEHISPFVLAFLLLTLTCNCWLGIKWHIEDPVKYLWWNFFVKIVDSFWLFIVFAQKSW